MAAASETLANLRRQLAERFPTAMRSPTRTLRTGIPAIDDATGGLPVAAIAELVCAAPSCGGSLFFAQLLAVTRAARQRVALIDSGDAFDPASLEADSLAHLVWVRCSNTPQAMSAADLLARDANFGLVVLDLRRAPALELRRIPSPQWYRLQRAVEPTDLTLLVETPIASVPSAQVRFVLDRTQPFAALHHERPRLTAELVPTLQRQRMLATSAAS